jgi:hypothetical protein
VQRTQSKLRLAAALNTLFDYLVWNCHCDRRGSSGMGAEAQQVRSPEVVVKIQFLRLVHSFCDHSEYKRVILSREEIDEIIKYNNECFLSIVQIDRGYFRIAIWFWKFWIFQDYFFNTPFISCPPKKSCFLKIFSVNPPWKKLFFLF